MKVPCKQMSLSVGTKHQQREQASSRRQLHFSHQRGAALTGRVGLPGYHSLRPIWYREVRLRILVLQSAHLTIQNFEEERWLCKSLPVSNSKRWLVRRFRLWKGVKSSGPVWPFPPEAGFQFFSSDPYMSEEVNTPRLPYKVEVVCL